MYKTISKFLQRIALKKKSGPAVYKQAKWYKRREDPSSGVISELKHKIPICENYPSRSQAPAWERTLVQSSCFGLKNRKYYI